MSRGKKSASGAGEKEKERQQAMMTKYIESNQLPALSLLTLITFSFLDINNIAAKTLQLWGT